MKAVSRAATAALSACALALALLGGISSQAAAAPQATPMASPTPMAMPSPMPMPNPAVTPAGNPVPTAPSPGTDMLNNNPNGGAWLDKFNRQPTPEPNAAKPATKPMMTMPANHPAVPARCRALMKAYAKKAITPAQHAKLKAQCMGKKPM